jgi:NAD(P)-dependent dehydrogenase (short-subunit alcohol dehydrogenase family)
MFFKNIAYTVDAILRFILGIPMKREVGRCNASLLKEEGEKELAVLITSCDTGLGRDLTHRLADRGFIVFAACQTEHGSRQFYSRKKSIVGIKCDITKEEDVVASANLVSTWLADNSSARQNRIPRYLHAVINNSGTHTTTLGGEQEQNPYCKKVFTECFDISEYRRAMEGKNNVLLKR